eukprot:scaffold187899_cov30-Prasinocladus_malaysianus.AAC.1
MEAPGLPESSPEVLAERASRDYALVGRYAWDAIGGLAGPAEDDPCRLCQLHIPCAPGPDQQLQHSPFGRQNLSKQHCQ